MARCRTDRSSTMGCDSTKFDDARDSNEVGRPWSRRSPLVTRSPPRVRWGYGIGRVWPWAATRDGAPAPGGGDVVGKRQNGARLRRSCGRCSGEARTPEERYDQQQQQPTLARRPAAVPMTTRQDSATPAMRSRSAAADARDAAARRTTAARSVSLAAAALT
ncbi:hypothetical protein Scep_017594 [Stephania cephalantha]|uniref:Uncharacterized protein n=1 Tax=Stephania cephalantha TaxID=152367 RepID=A0AAP0NX35_9MAGN